MKLCKNISKKVSEQFIKYEKFYLILLFFLLAGSLYLALYSYPLISDDFVYSKQWQSNLNITNIDDIIFYQWKHYFEWGGRTVAHSIVQLLFLIDSSIASLLTAFTFLGLCYFSSTLLSERKNIYIYFISIACIYFLNPEFDETVLWRTGAGNYLWTTFVILISFIPLKSILNEYKVANWHWWLLIISFFAGWTNENIAPVVIALNIYVLYISYREKKYICLIYQLISTSVMAIGAALLLFAPGNYARANTFSSGLMSLAYRGHGQVNSWFNWLFLAWLLLFITTYFVYKKNLKFNIFSKLMIFCSISTSVIMIASPSYPSRATFGTLVFICMVICSNLEKLFQRDMKLLKIIGIFCCIAFIGSMLSIGVLQLVRNMGINIPG